MILPIVTSYTSLQLRLGYLKLIAALGSRTPTTQEGLERDFAPYFPSPPAKSALGRVAPPEKTYMEWMFAVLGHEKGLLTKQNVHELVAMGKAFDFLHPVNCSLLEIAIVLRAIMTTPALDAIAKGDVAAAFNPLILDEKGDHLERAFFVYLLLSKDLPTALVCCAAAERDAAFHLYGDFPPPSEPLVEGKNATRTLKKSAASKPTDDPLTPYAPKNILLRAFQLIKPKATKQLALKNWKAWTEYFEGNEPVTALSKIKYLRMGKRSSYRHHAAPRLEFLVDLGLLSSAGSVAEHEDSSYNYRRNDCTQRFAAYLKEHLLESDRDVDIGRFLRHHTIKLVEQTYGLNLEEGNADDKLRFLVEGYSAVKRVFGTTPMWTSALMASLLAMKAGVRLEAGEFYDLAKEAAQQPNTKIRLSGGSRFDGEFLIGIAPDLVGKITSHENDPS